MKWADFREYIYEVYLGCNSSSARPFYSFLLVELSTQKSGTRNSSFFYCKQEVISMSALDIIFSLIFLIGEICVLIVTMILDNIEEFTTWLEKKLVCKK